SGWRRAARSATSSSPTFRSRRRRPRRPTEPRSVEVVGRSRPVPLPVLEVVVHAELRVGNPEELERAQQDVAPERRVREAERPANLREVEADLDTDLLVARLDDRVVAVALREEDEGRLEEARDPRRPSEVRRNAGALEIHCVDLARVVDAEQLPALDEAVGQGRRDLAELEAHDVVEVAALDERAGEGADGV